LKAPEARTRAAAPVLGGCPARTGKEVVLTFDDGPSPYTDELLDLLKKEGIHATFFLKGKELGTLASGYEDNRRRARRIRDEGHEICNHTLTHRKLTTLSDAEIVEEMNTSEALLAETTGLHTRCMRPPFGDYDDRVLSVVRGLGYEVLMWNLNTYDWKYASTEQPVFDPPRIMSYVREVTREATKPLIHIQHDALDMQASIRMVPRVVDYLRQSGWRMISLSECLGAPIYRSMLTGR
jgi:peptidoglycan/xylan/chitin deacetylase (PgdA/CDA1 family)